MHEAEFAIGAFSGIVGLGTTVAALMDCCRPCGLSSESDRDNKYLIYSRAILSSLASIFCIATIIANGMAGRSQDFTINFNARVAEAAMDTLMAVANGMGFVTNCIFSARSQGYTSI